MLGVLGVLGDTLEVTQYFCDSDSFFDFEFDQSEKYPSTPSTPSTLHTNDWRKVCWGVLGVLGCLNL